MSVESKIINNSKDSLKALVNRAKTAQEKPDNGIKIVTKGAFFVIRDCAMITNKFLPNYLYGKYKNPIKDLKGKFTKKEVIRFCASTDVESIQLKRLMVLDALEAKEPKTILIKPADPNDIYGDYGSDVEIREESSDDETDADILIEVFKAK